jgi:hypothetical protein
MKNRPWGVLLTVGLLLTLANVPVAVAQPVLQRLEQAIRDRVAQAPTAAAPAEAPAEAKPAAPAGTIPPPPAIRHSSQAEQPRGYLGAVVDDKNDRGRGVRVLEVRADGPAAKAGLKTDDLITAIAGMRVRQLSDMADVLSLYPPGEAVAIDLLREEKPQHVKVTLGHSPTTPGPVTQPAPTLPSPNEQPVPPTHAPPAAPALSPPPTAPPQPEAVGPGLPGLPPANPATDHAARIDQLQRRVDELEQRVAELEKTLAEAKKEK